MNAHSGTQVILASIGLEGLSGNEAGLVNFYRFWHDERGLELKILIGERMVQWVSKTIPWAYQNWMGPCLGRNWALLDFEDLVNAIEGHDSTAFAQEYLQQIRKCLVSRSHVSEGRLRVGRNTLEEDSE